VTQQQIEAALTDLNAVADRGAPPDDKRLARKLVESGVITSYQAEQLQAGRTKLNLGPYIVTDWLGQGGMGQVFKAVHRMMRREVALKVLPQSKSTPEAISAFNREIRAQAQLDHPNLVRAYDAGHDGNVHFLVTEFVPGTDLRRWVRVQGHLSMAQAASVIAQAARGLAHAHERGLVHRDVKPGNILVTPDGRAKVSDLGLAGSQHDDGNDPRAGKIVGTADYLAPEQIRKPHEILPVSDVYALGCTLYYAVTGKVPFPGGTTRDKARRHCDETPWHPRRFNPEISDEFVDVIADMMAKDPRSRIQTAAEVAARLEPWARGGELLPAQQMDNSPWLRPPLPLGGEDTPAGSEEVESGSLGGSEGVPRGPGTGSQTLEGTEVAAAAPDETERMTSRARPLPPPILLDGTPSPTLKYVLVALAIAVPVAMLLGAVATLALLSWTK